MKDRDMRWKRHGSMEISFDVHGARGPVFGLRLAQPPMPTWLEVLLFSRFCDSGLDFIDCVWEALILDISSLRAIPGIMYMARSDGEVPKLGPRHPTAE